MARWWACCSTLTCGPGRNAWTSTPCAQTCRRRPPDPTAPTIAELAWVAEKGLQATTTEEIAAVEGHHAHSLCHYLAKLEVVWSEYQPMLTGYVAAAGRRARMEA